MAEVRKHKKELGDIRKAGEEKREKFEEQHQKVDEQKARHHDQTNEEFRKTRGS